MLYCVRKLAELARITNPQVRVELGGRDCATNFIGGLLVSVVDGVRTLGSHLATRKNGKQQAKTNLTIRHTQEKTTHKTILKIVVHEG